MSLRFLLSKSESVCPTLILSTSRRNRLYNITSYKESYAISRKILYRQLDLATRTLGTYNLARYKPAVHGILGFIKDNPDLFGQRFEAKQRFVTKFLNQVGGVKPLSFFDESFFTQTLNNVRERIATVS